MMQFWQSGNAAFFFLFGLFIYSIWLHLTE
jgi:hypothetical protein